eukprot:g1441.t1
MSNVPDETVPKQETEVTTTPATTETGIKEAATHEVNEVIPEEVKNEVTKKKPFLKNALEKLKMKFRKKKSTAATEEEKPRTEEAGSSEQKKEETSPTNAVANAAEITEVKQTTEDLNEEITAPVVEETSKSKEQEKQDPKIEEQEKQEVKIEEQEKTEAAVVGVQEPVVSEEREQDAS